MTAREVLERLEGVRESGDGWTARCPAHDDEHNSASIGQGRDGRILIKCHAGCEVEQVVAAAGLTMADLFPGEPSANDHRGHFTVGDLARLKRLPERFLRDYGLREKSDFKANGRMYVQIPYKNRDGSTFRYKHRKGPVAKRSSFWGKGKGTIPFGLDLLAAEPPNRPVVIVEGESDALTLWHHNLSALGISGANGWKREFAEYVEGRDVFVWREPDDGGDKFVGSILKDRSDAFVIIPPEGTEDASDLHVHDPDGFKRRLTELVEDAKKRGPGGEPEEQRQEEHAREDDVEHEQGNNVPQKTLLINLSSGHYLFTDERDRPHVWLDRDTHREVWPLESSRFRSWMAYRFYQETGSVPASSVVSDALVVLLGQARFEGETHRLHNRLARDADGVLWYDLADDRWRAIRVDASGWEIVEDPPLLFRRFSHQQPQIEPVPGGSLQDLLPFLNLASSEDEVLVPVWLVAALIPDIPRAILVLHGPQGSAKSTATRMLRTLIDPSLVPMPRFPHSDAEMAQVLDHHAAPFFDNLSALNARTSDTLCRAITGDGFSKRKLYSDDDDFIYQFRRVIVANGINIPAQRPDLLDRCVLIRLEQIPEEKRREEGEFWGEFEARRSRIFGAVLSTLADAMLLEPSVRLDGNLRMADWTRWGFAIAEAAGLGGERFLDAYRANRVAQNQEALSSHPVGAAVIAFMADREEWKGEPSELLRELEKVAQRERIDTQQRLWPKASNWLRRRLNEVETNLAEAGIRYEPGFGATGGCCACGEPQPRAKEARKIPWLPWVPWRARPQLTICPYGIPTVTTTRPSMPWVRGRSKKPRQIRLPTAPTAPTAYPRACLPTLRVSPSTPRRHSTSCVTRVRRSRRQPAPTRPATAGRGRAVAGSAVCAAYEQHHGTPTGDRPPGPLRAGRQAVFVSLPRWTRYRPTSPPTWRTAWPSR